MSHPTTGSDGTAGSSDPFHPQGPDTGPMLTTHGAVVILSAVFIGAVFGLLTYAVTPNLPAAVLAGLTATGASFLGLRTVIGR